MILRARAACLDDLRLLSDRQPARLRVEAGLAGAPAVWLHDQNDMAWVIVNFGVRDWSKPPISSVTNSATYCQTVAANSKPRPPSQWVRKHWWKRFRCVDWTPCGGWKTSPPFAGDETFGDALRNTRVIVQLLCHPCCRPRSAGRRRDLVCQHRAEIEAGGLVPYGQAMAASFWPIRWRPGLRRSAGGVEPMAGAQPSRNQRLPGSMGKELC